MTVRIITGTAGSGKTAYARGRAASLAREGERVALLVPEQFSFETERAIIQMLPPSEAARVEVYSFSRLAARVARQTGGLAGRRLDESGRAAVMSVAMAQVQDHLTLYAGMRRGQELIAEMLATVGEFKSCAITPDMLEETAQNAGEQVLAQKLRELSLIYGAYNALIAQIGSLDPLDDLTRLARNLEEWAYLEGMTVIADSFTGFTQQEWNVLEKILPQCDAFEITLCYEDPPENGREPEGKPTLRRDLFAESRRTFNRLREWAGKDVPVERVTLEGHPRFAHPALAAAESGLFRMAAQPPHDGDTDAVTVYEAADRYDEAAFAALEIRRLVREKELRWRDFAIICRTAEDYQQPVLRALSLQGIPAFCDRRVTITDLPLVRFALAALDVAGGRWRTEDILRWVKTGMVRDVSYVEAARLENYCFLWNISGARKWKNAFTQSPYGFTDRPPEDESERLAEIEALRAAVTAPLERFETAVLDENATGRDMAAALFRLTDEAGAAECVERMLPSLSPTDAETQGQVWNALMHVLDQLADILADTVIPFRTFTELFRLMVGLCDVGRIPQGLDEVVFGAADRIRTPDVRAVFVLGANDGLFPRTPSPGGLFSDTERRELIHLHLPLSGDMEDSVLNEQYLTYHAMTCASERLTVCYAKSCNGEELYSSEAVSELLRCVPRCRQLRHGDLTGLERLESAEAGFLLAAASVRECSGFAAALLRCYEQREAYADKLAVVRAGTMKSEHTLHNMENARALFGRRLRLSATKAECFFKCRFMYFCQYGMKAAPRRRADLDPLEYGSVVHYVLEKLLQSGDPGVLAESGELEEKIRDCLTEYLEQVMGGADMKSARFLYLFRRLVRTLTVLAGQLREEFANSLFRPVSFELPIDGQSVQPLRLPLSDGSTLEVGGKIDRVDVYEQDGVRYLRVVDYKTGSKEFVLSDVLAGLNMQMLIYLDILCGSASAEDACRPAGVLYSPAALRRINGVRGVTSFDEERKDMLKNNGLLIDDGDVLQAMESGMEKKVDKKENASVKGARTFRSSTYVATPGQFESIRRYTEGLLREMGEALHGGRIEAVPVKGQTDACEHCDYRVMCSLACRESGRQVKKFSMTETLQQMESARTGTEGGEDA